MSRNLIQFQPGLSLSKFIKLYGTQALCDAALEATRWPSGFRCPHCGDTRHSLRYRSDRKLFQCYRCRRQTSLTAGTIFDSTKLSLTIWFLAMHLLTQAKNNVSTLELSRHLGVSYNTAWLIKHKLLQVMEEREQTRELIGRIEIDDAYLGGEHRGKRGRGSPNKFPFVAAVQTNDEGHPLFVRFDRVDGFTHDESNTGLNKHCPLLPWPILTVSVGLLFSLRWSIIIILPSPDLVPLRFNTRSSSGLILFWQT